MAKLWLTELEGRVTDRCVQLHGGAGYMDEYPISKLYMRREFIGSTVEPPRS